ncbi:MAG: outer membrane lipoprotein carrier protein LolA [candidate division WOR-3 bacterium]
MKLFLILIFSLSWEEIKEEYKNLENIYGKVREIIYSEGIPACTLIGKIYVKRDLFKMVIEKPESQIIYSTKDSTLIYFPSWKEVQVSKTPKFISDFFILNIDEYADSIFFGEKDFKIEIFLKKNLDLPYKKIIVILEKNNKDLKNLILVEGDVIFEFTFLLFKKNMKFSEETFKIFLPEGVRKVKVSEFDN